VGLDKGNEGSLGGGPGRQWVCQGSSVNGESGAIRSTSNAVAMASYSVKYDGGWTIRPDNLNTRGSEQNVMDLSFTTQV